MTIKETIEQLKDLRRSQKAFIIKRGSEPEPDNPFMKDAEAIETAVHVLEVVEKMINGGSLNGSLFF